MDCFACINLENVRLVLTNSYQLQWKKTTVGDLPAVLYVFTVYTYVYIVNKILLKLILVITYCKINLFINKKK